MMEKEQLRRADFVTSIILMVFSLWMLSETFKMPMKDTFGGVSNVWYVSPALMPLFIGASIFVLGFVLLMHSIQSGGAKQFIDRFRAREHAIPESTVRFLSILLALITFVYLNIPRVDFFLCIVLFLFYFISAFYFDDETVLKKTTLFYAAGHILLLLLFVTGVAGMLRSTFLYAIDVLVLVFIVLLVVYTRRLVGTGEVNRRRFRVTMVVTVVVPLLLVPVFRYGLRVPLPVEGGIVELMNLAYYSLR